MQQSFFTKNKILLTLIFLLIGGFFNIAQAKIEINIERNYTVNTDLKMHVEEVHNIFNNTDNLYIPAGEEVEFEILGFKNNDPKEKENLEAILRSIKLYRNNSAVSFNHEFGPNKLIIKTNYSGNFYPGAQTKFILRYEHPGLIYKNGAINEVYIHAFGSDFKFELPNTQYSFDTKLKIPKNYVNNHFIFPDPTSKLETENEIVFDYEQSKLINQYVYLQLGNIQIYDFELVQSVIPTESKHTGLKNRYELIIPRDFKNNTIEQQIFIESIKPEPVLMRTDEEGNLIGVFDFYTDQIDQIRIDGYGVLKIDHNKFETKVGKIKDISRDIVTKYTQPAEFWEVDDSKIIKAADSVPAYNSNVYELAVSMYKYVVDSIDYSQVKKFGLNERQGAVATLNGGAAVCMEYSDLYLTLMRARGIPARAAFGYGYDPQKAKEQQEAHQWVQIYMPGLDYNWVDVDVTWGEGGNTLIGGDLNHFYTHFAYKDPNTPNVIARNSFGSNATDNLTAPKINISSVDKIPEDKQVTKLEEIIEKYKEEAETDFDYSFTQFINRYKAGFTGLFQSPDLNNSSQLITLSTVFLLGVVFFYILTPLYTYRRKRIKLK